MNLYPGSVYYNDHRSNDFLPYGYTTGSRNIKIGSKFYGSIREVRIWNTFL